MITLGGGATKIHLATSPIDSRRGYGGLYTLIEQQFDGEPQSGHLWVFFNKTRSLLKIFWWDDGGMVVLGKRLREGTYRITWPQRGQKTVPLTAAELQLLLSGLDIAKLRPRRWVRQPRPETSLDPSLAQLEPAGAPCQ